MSEHLLAFGEVMSVLGKNAGTLSKHPEYAKMISDFLEKFVQKEKCTCVVREEHLCPSCSLQLEKDRQKKVCGDCESSAGDKECRGCSGFFCNDCVVPEVGNFYCRDCYH